MKYLVPAMLAAFAFLAGPSEARMRLGAAKPMSAGTFAQKVAVSDWFEIQSSQLALQKSHDGEIRKFVQRMIDGHTKPADQLKAALKQANLPEPGTDLDREHQALLTKLQNENGAVFDRTYVRDQGWGISRPSAYCEAMPGTAAMMR
jgi:putative membrane protein